MVTDGKDGRGLKLEMLDYRFHARKNHQFTVKPRQAYPPRIH